MVVVVVTRKYQVTIPKEIREALDIHIGDRLVVKVVDGKIIMEPIKGWKALEKLSSIADRYFKGPKRIDIVDLIEESLERETGMLLFLVCRSFKVSIGFGVGCSGAVKT